jgi:hypothetical protein
MPCRQSGLPNRQLLSAKAVFEFRLERHQESKSTAADTKQDKKGKKRVQRLQEELEPEASGSGPSPSTSLLPLDRMTLESMSSNGDSPVLERTGSQLSLPGLFSVEIPLPHVTPHPRIIVPPFQRHRPPSPSALSKSSDDGQNITARVAALEERMNRLEEWRAEDARWKKLVDCRLKDAGL